MKYSYFITKDTENLLNRFEYLCNILFVLYCILYYKQILYYIINHSIPILIMYKYLCTDEVQSHIIFYITDRSL